MSEVINLESDDECEGNPTKPIQHLDSLDEAIWRRFNAGEIQDDEWELLFSNETTTLNGRIDRKKSLSIREEFKLHNQNTQQLENHQLDFNNDEMEVPDIYTLFQFYDVQFFHSMLKSVEVRWSTRMTLCAGVCVYQKGGYCSIRLSEPLLQFRSAKEFRETLLHEMIHAYLFVTQNNRDHDGHGPSFQHHMKRINQLSGLNITVYHNFKDEVNYYRTHIWKCDGPCQYRAPYFGLVKRSMNRIPGPYDWWWQVHQRSCGGQYKKIAEPTKTTRKKKIKKSEDRCFIDMKKKSVKKVIST